MNVGIFSDIGPCSPFVNRRFGGKYHLHLQCRELFEQETRLQQIYRLRLALLSRLIFGPEAGRDIFLRNVSSHTDYIAEDNIHIKYYIEIFLSMPCDLSLNKRLHIYILCIYIMYIYIFIYLFIDLHSRVFLNWTGNICYVRNIDRCFMMRSTAGERLKHNDFRITSINKVVVILRVKDFSLLTHHNFQQQRILSRL
jgi:hypothetical protein